MNVDNKEFNINGISYVELNKIETFFMEKNFVVSFDKLLNKDRGFKGNLVNLIDKYCLFNNIELNTGFTHFHARHIHNHQDLIYKISSINNIPNLFLVSDSYFSEVADDRDLNFFNFLKYIIESRYWAKTYGSFLE